MEACGENKRECRRASGKKMIYNANIACVWGKDKTCGAGGIEGIQRVERNLRVEKSRGRYGWED